MIFLFLSLKVKRIGGKGRVMEQFKNCHLCGYQWESRTKFLEDSNIKIIGYQISFIDLKEGLFLFNHSCGDTLALKAVEFIDLYKGPIFAENMHGSEECSGKCLYKGNLDRCPVQCECSYVREVIDIIKNWKKV